MKWIVMLVYIVIGLLVLITSFSVGYLTGIEGSTWKPVTSIQPIEYYDIDTVRCSLVIPEEFTNNIVLRDIYSEYDTSIDSIYVSYDGSYEIFERDTMEYDNEPEVRGS